jgi:MYXO-CTERM domain-containing protein
VCNDAVDDDCDGLADDLDPGVDLTTGNVWYLDADGDAFGDLDAPLATCVDLPLDYADNATDCDDTDAEVNPGAVEVCNDELDDNCNGLADDADETLDLSTRDTWCLDSDGDTFGDPAVATITCAGAPADYVADGTDCDDAEALSFPGNPEVCDGLDNDCNLGADDGLTFEDWYVDADGDAYGDPDTLLSTCDGAPADSISDGTDCDDSNANVNPGEAEVFDNEIDDDCNGLVDQDDPAFEGCGGCSSGTTPTPVAWLGLASLIGLAARRRR